MKRSFCKTLFLLLILFSASLYADKPVEVQQLLSPSETKRVLKSIVPYAIVFGKGEQEVHVFIDPYCPFTQKYLSLLLENSQQKFKKNTYYFYLYKLKNGDSTEAIQTIMSSENKKEMLLAITIEDDFFIDENIGVEEKIQAIADAAKKIGVYKRPYILIDGKLQH